MTTTAERIAELTAEWEAATEDTASDYVLTEDDWSVGLGTEGAAEIVALLARLDEDQERAERIARQTLAAHGTDYNPRGWFCDCGHAYGASPMGLPALIELHRMTAAALRALSETENAR